MEWRWSWRLELEREVKFVRSLASQKGLSLIIVLADGLGVDALRLCWAGMYLFECTR